MAKWVFVMVFVIVTAIVIVLLRTGEDSWIKDERGVWIEHGNPKEIPAYVVNQQNLIANASQLYIDKKEKGMNFSSQCLGYIEGYAIDIVHNPKIPEDYLQENICDDYREGKVTHFVELDQNGVLVRIG